MKPKAVAKVPPRVRADKAGAAKRPAGRGGAEGGPQRPSAFPKRPARKALQGSVGASPAEAAAGASATQPTNLTDRAHATLRRLILERELPGGEVLVEGRLAERLQMSRTPLREALLRLEGEGLLVRANARSYAVRRITASHYFQCLQVRERLESQAVALALPRLAATEMRKLRALVESLDASQQGSSHWHADDEIHGLFARSSGNEMLAETIAHLRVLCRLFEVVDPFNRIEADRREHLAILDACLAGDAKAAERAVVAHLQQLARYTLGRLSNGLVGAYPG